MKNHDFHHVSLIFDKANEYCHRHGGELFVPDMYYWKYFFNPLCDRQLTNSNPFQTTFSNQDYWINIRRSLSGSEMNLKTSSSWQMYNQFDPNNLYTGWDASQNVVDTGNFPNDYEYFIGNGSNVYFGSNAAKLKVNHERICDDCVASSDYYRALI